MAETPGDIEQVGFVWSGRAFNACAGGSETYTLRHITELQNRGIDARLILLGEAAVLETIGQSIPTLALGDKSELCELDDSLVFVSDPVYDLDLAKPSFVVLHIPVAGASYDKSDFYKENGTGEHIPIVTSQYMARQWQDILDLSELPPVVYPPIDSAFSEQPRASVGPDGSSRVLFAGRPTPGKGIFTLLASMHLPPLYDQDYELTCVKTVSYGIGADTIHTMLEANPDTRTVEPQHDAASMAGLYALHDVVVVPSAWEESFGMISVEAQHAGCRVVASDIGGLPETDCGSLILAKPNDPQDLAKKLAEAIELGPLTSTERNAATQRFSAKDSADALLDVLRSHA